MEAPRAAGVRPRGTGGPHAARLVDRATLGAAPDLRRPLAAPENARVNKSVQMARTRRLEVRGDPITAMSGCSNFEARLVGVKLRDKLPSHGCRGPPPAQPPARAEWPGGERALPRTRGATSTSATRERAGVHRARPPPPTSDPAVALTLAPALARALA